MQENEEDVTTPGEQAKPGFTIIGVVLGLLIFAVALVYYTKTGRQFNGLVNPFARPTATPTATATPLPSATPTRTPVPTIDAAALFHSTPRPQPTFVPLATLQALYHPIEQPVYMTSILPPQVYVPPVKPPNITIQYPRPYTLSVLPYDYYYNPIYHYQQPVQIPNIQVPQIHLYNPPTFYTPPTLINPPSITMPQILPPSFINPTYHFPN